MWGLKQDNSTAMDKEDLKSKLLVENGIISYNSSS